MDEHDQAMEAYRKVLSSCTDAETYEVWQYLTQWIHVRGLRKSQAELIEGVREMTYGPPQRSPG